MNEATTILTRAVTAFSTTAFNNRSIGFWSSSVVMSLPIFPFFADTKQTLDASD